MISTISPTCVNRPLSDNGVIIDVRTDMEHSQAHLPCPHIHLPLDQINAVNVSGLCGSSKDRPLYLLCKAGVRAMKAAEKLAAEGYTNLHVIEGGLDACQLQGVACASEQG